MSIYILRVRFSWGSLMGLDLNSSLLKILIIMYSDYRIMRIRGEMYCWLIRIYRVYAKRIRFILNINFDGFEDETLNAFKIWRYTGRIVGSQLTTELYIPSQTQRKVRERMLFLVGKWTVINNFKPFVRSVSSVYVKCCRLVFGKIFWP
jgi:hypothetical protein